METKIKQLLEDENLINILKNKNIDEILKGDIDPDLLQKLMGNETFKEAVEQVEQNSNNKDNEDMDENEEYEHKFYAEDKVRLINLNNAQYNNKDGLVDDYDYEKKRYIVCVDEKMLAIKEENLELINTTIENID